MNYSNKTIIGYAVGNAVGTVLYITLVALFLFNAERIFDNEPSVLIPIAMLMLFVFSATVCAALMLGRPVLWFMESKKKEALSLFAYTLAVFFVIIFAVFFTLYVINI